MWGFMKEFGSLVDADSVPNRAGEAYIKYSVMHSDRNSFYGDAVLESVSMAYRVIDITIEQIYDEQIFLDHLSG